MDRNLVRAGSLTTLGGSLSARRAWIEISGSTKPRARRAVALRKESVDRNYIIKITGITPTAVALRKESVDRNQVAVHFDTLSALSLSARRAWIEIF